MGDDWDLHAVVRGCAAAAPTAEVDLRPLQGHLGVAGARIEDGLISFPAADHRLESRNTDEELQDLYRPFIPASSSPPSLSPQSMSFGPPPPPSPLFRGPNHDPKTRLEPQKQHHQRQQLHAASIRSNRTKRRKNQLKRVCHIPAEGLTSDVWAWRKYGQKPIKGSPYPRGYYRCSSSKGCLARKQVERNKSDPAMFIVTYTAEHNHPAPTHRNSLAGSTRQKPSFSASAAAAVDGDPDKAADKASPSPGSPGSGVSNTTPSSPGAAKADSRAGEENLPAELDDEDEEFGLLSEMTMNDDDFFEGLEELDGGSAGDCFSDQLPAAFAHPWTANNAATAAGGS